MSSVNDKDFMKGQCVGGGADLFFRTNVEDDVQSLLGSHKSLGKFPIGCV